MPLCDFVPRYLKVNKQQQQKYNNHDLITYHLLMLMRFIHSGCCRVRQLIIFQEDMNDFTYSFH